jgi:chemotaxis protein methyltransferase CheR
LCAAEKQLTPLTDREYQLIRDLVYERFGISLGESKRSLIVGRLNKLLKEQGLSNFSQYYEHVTTDNTGQALAKLIDRISTNHTFFYREYDHFEYFQQTVLPTLADKLKSQGKKSFRLWCPGCSSGEEPYTLAMLMLEYFSHDSISWDVGVLATDISSRVLKKAQNGIYEKESVAHLPSTLVKKYFHRVGEGQMEINDQIKNLVLLRRLNLMRPDYPFKNKFSIIFCRNVMIYFDHPTRMSLVQRFHRYLEDDGYLFIGHSETLGRGDRHFRYIRPAVYQRNAVS